MMPLLRSTSFKPPRQELIDATREAFGVDEVEAVRILHEDKQGVEYWVNDIYQVEVRRASPPGFTQINIRRRDGNVIFRDWRHFQQIKNQLVGPEVEAVELYPAESRLVDTSNKYHLWAIEDPEHRFPFGWRERDILARTDKGGPSGLRQRPISQEKRRTT